MPYKREIQQEIQRFIVFEDFMRIHRRLDELRKEEEQKLVALADLQKAFNAAKNDFERDYVKNTVGKLRDMSKAARTEIRELKEELLKHLSLEQANDLYHRWQIAE